MKLKKLLVMALTCVIALTSFTLTAYANPSTYWCLTHRRTGCSHCSNHTIVNVGTATANCVDGGGQIRVCTTSGCGSTFYQTAPLGHSYSHNVCTQLQSCGKVNTSNSSHFQHYMYRRGNHARTIPTNGGWLGYGGHRAIDITNGSGTSISGFPIYAQGPGEVVIVAGSATSTAGFYVVVHYDNGYVARYLHVAQNGRVANGSRVTSQTKIANTSNTGKASDGSLYGHHLHFDVIHSSNAGQNYVNLGMSNLNNLNPTNLFPSGTFN